MEVVMASATPTTARFLRMFMVSSPDRKRWMVDRVGCGSLPALVLLPGFDRNPGAVVRATVGQAVHAEVVVADLVLGLAGQVRVVDRRGVDVPRPVTLTRVPDPGGEADLAQSPNGGGA